MKRLITVAAGFALLASTAWESHSWGNYHWARTSNPFTVTLVDSAATSAWDTALASASSD